MLFLGVFGILSGALTFFVLYQVIDIPDANANFQTETTTVYYSDGEHKIGTFATQDRDSIPGEEMPDSIKDAVVAAEDRTFYTNRGIDLKGIVRAARNNATTDTTQGASTITQQYVKIMYLTQERTWTRKIKEAILSIKIHNQLSKQEIMEGYLNTIYFGNGAYGIEVAAQTYFRKPAKELTVPESAALATIINNPTYYDPYGDNAVEHMTPRYNYVINGMVDMGALDPAEAEKYLGNLPEFKPKQTSDRYGGTEGYLMSTVQKRMKKLEFTDSQINGGGLKIVTTFDYEAQNNAVEAVEETKPEGLEELHVGLVAIEVGTSAVRAMYGGEDYLESQLNWAMIGSQPGSTFKPFAVAAALSEGFSLTTALNGNSPYVFENGDRVANEGRGGGRSYGIVSLRTALAESVNTAFMDLTVQMDNGPEEILEAAAKAGLPDDVIERYDPVRVVSLGYARVPTIDMANAYATYANEGKSATWYMIESVTDQTGRELFKHKVKAKQTVDEDIAADVTSALQSVVQSGTGANGRTICPTAGKTGTATAGQGQGQEVSSSWFIGFTPKLVTAVMYARGDGNDSLEGYLVPFFGANYPAKTFRNFMDPTLEGTKCGTFAEPSNMDGDEGKEFVPTPTCDQDEVLNESRTRCEPKPPPECEPDEQLNGDGTACVPKPPETCPPGQSGVPPDCAPAPTPTPQPCPGDPTTFPPNCSAPGGGNDGNGGNGGNGGNDSDGNGNDGNASGNGNGGGGLGSLLG